MCARIADAGCMTRAFMLCAAIRECCFFAGLYASLHYAFALPWPDAALYSALNLLLASAEDKWFFPRSIGGYDEYKKRVPFLIPTSAGIKEIFKK